MIDTLLLSNDFQRMSFLMNTYYDEEQGTQGMKVLDSTWVFKCKQFPDGSVQKLKTRFCVRGDQQVERVGFFDKFPPVVQWSRIRLLFMASKKQDKLITRLCLYTHCWKTKLIVIFQEDID